MNVSVREEHYPTYTSYNARLTKSPAGHWAMEACYWAEPIVPGPWRGSEAKEKGGRVGVG
jgi:hypothetical protein